jgi:hypothetical protein
MSENDNKFFENFGLPHKKVGEDKNSPKGDDNGNNLIPSELLNAIPVEERSKVISIIRQSMYSSVSRHGNPIAEKITTEHISQIINKSDDLDKRDREERKNQRSYNLILILLGLSFIGFLIVYLQKDKELLIKIIVAIISFVGGFGLGKSTGKKEE